MKCCIILLFSVTQDILNHGQGHVLLRKVPAKQIAKGDSFWFQGTFEVKANVTLKRK